MAYWKKLKNTDAVPVLKDELVFDTTPTVNSTNPVTSDGVARAIAGASGEVPVVTESDNGKILTAVYDEGGAAVEWAEAPSGVPSASSTDDGKVLGATYNGLSTSVGWVVPTVNADGETIAGNGTVDAPLSVKHDSSLGTASVFSEIIDESNLSWTNNQYIDVTVTEAQVNAIHAKLNNAEPVYLGMLFSGGPTIKLNSSSSVSGKSCYMHIGTPTWSYLFIAVSTNSLGTTNGSGVVSVDLSSLALSSFTCSPEYMLPGTWRIWFSASSRQYTDPIEERSNDLYNVTVDGSTAVTTEFRMGSSENALAVTNPVPAYSTTTDLGKVLTVTANGLEWVTPA